MTENTERVADHCGAHMSHCFQGENRHVCKYGDVDCPAAMNDHPDHPDDATLGHEDRAIALVRHLASSTDQTQLEQARIWACKLVEEMEHDHGTI